MTDLQYDVSYFQYPMMVRSELKPSPLLNPPLFEIAGSVVHNISNAIRGARPSSELAGGFNGDCTACYYRCDGLTSKAVLGRQFGRYFGCLRARDLQYGKSGDRVWCSQCLRTAMVVNELHIPGIYVLGTCCGAADMFCSTAIGVACR